MEDKKIVLSGIHLTVLAAFLIAYSGTSLATPSFGLAAIGTIIAGYGIFRN